MLIIDRQNSHITWVYKMIDNREIYKIHEFDNMADVFYNHIYIIRYMDQLYVFGGNLGKSYKSYIGFQTSDEEIKSYKEDIFKLFMTNMEFNFEGEEI